MTKIPSAYFIPEGRNDFDCSPIEPKNGTDFQLQELYDILSCKLIEVVRLDNMILIIDEEGRLKDRPVNKFASIFQRGMIVGDAIICKSDMLK